MQVSGLKVGDMVILKPSSARMLYDGCQFGKKIYKEIHQKSLTGKILQLGLEDNHYLYGEYAVVKWDNNHESKRIHTSWLIMAP